MSNPIDWSKPIETVDGVEAKLVHTFPGSEYPRLVVFGQGFCRVDENGRSAAVDTAYFRNKPVEYLSDPVYVNEYTEARPVFHQYLGDANRRCGEDRTRVSVWRFSATRGWVKEAEYK